MKNFVLTAMVVLALAVGAQAAVIQSSDSAYDGGSPLGTLTIADFDTDADTDLLLVALGGMFKNSGTLDTLITGPTFGTTTLTQLPGSYAQDGTGGWDQHVAWYYLENPGDVTADISYSSDSRVNGNAGLVAYSIKGATLSGVSTAKSIMDSSGTSMSTDITATANNTIVIDFITHDDAGGHTAHAGQTVLLDDDGDTCLGSSHKTVDAGTHSMGWNFDSSNDGEGAHSVIAIVPEPATMSLLALGGLGALLRRRRR